MERRKFLMFFGVGALANSLFLAIASRVNAANGFQQVGTVQQLKAAGSIYKEDANIVVIGDPTYPETVVAFNPACTHTGCIVDWENKDQIFICPCHSSIFNQAGNVIRGPARIPLQKWTVKIQGNNILVQKS